MWPIPPSFEPYISIVVVALVAVLVRRNIGWGWLIVVWLGLSGLVTLLVVIRVYRISPLSPQETRTYALVVAQAILILYLTIFGMVVWLVALIVPPRTAPGDGSSTAPPGGPEEAHELLRLPRRYQALLAAYREARQRAVVRPWSRRVFSAYVPSYIRQDLDEARQVLRAPDLFRRDFAAAASVLTELSEMPTARLSALEAYHRVNLRRVRQRLSPVRIIPGALLSVALVASRALSSFPIDLPAWDAARVSALAFVAQPQNLGLISGVGGILLGVIVGSILVWWMQLRLEAVGELLTVALAHRRLAQ